MLCLESLKQYHISHSPSELLKIADGWLVQALRDEGETPSGPGAFLVCSSRRTATYPFHVSSVLIVYPGRRGRAVMTDGVKWAVGDMHG